MNKISLDKQVHIYSVDTSCFYNDLEYKMHSQLNKHYFYRNRLKKLKAKKPADHVYQQKLDTYFENVNQRIKKFKKLLGDEFERNDDIRTLRTQAANERNIISIFDSVLIRTLQIPPDTLSEDIIYVQTYFFRILEDLIVKGFMFRGEKFICFTASAGQIRTKKTVFIKEKVFEKHRDSLMCGLSTANINKNGGVNINKYLAYLALCNSATDPWDEFDINKTIVVDDMETKVKCVVDFIDDKNYKIERKTMDVPITHTDGCGMILPKKSKKSMMVRLPWIKGLLVPFPFDKFIRENSKKAELKKVVVKDIYGKDYDILKDRIEIIFTKSQFKMWKYYSSWDEYKQNFIEFGCQAGTCNEEEDIVHNSKLNYQMLQTLTDMTNEELAHISRNSIKNIMNIGQDRHTMLRILGVTAANMHKNYYQQALEIYPELLNDTYSKEILKQVKKSLVKEAKSGKVDIEGKYAFLCPDLYAFCQYTFLNDKSPAGLLENNEVFCKMFEDGVKLDCLRSPHLYREHAIRINKVDKEKSRWFISKGIYTSCHDPISKLLMFDNDGDKSLVCSEPKLVDVAERNMKDIVPLFYNMAKAEAEPISQRTVYNGLITAYSGGNIGTISNDITKIWNSGTVNLDVIKWLCMENNFTIDYAKTLYKVQRPNDKKQIITQYTKSKVPYFFIFAKGKDLNQVNEANESVVNRLNNIIPNPRLNFKAANLGNFDYKILMSSPTLSVHLNQEIIDRYKSLDLKSHYMLNHDDESKSNYRYIYSSIRNQLLSDGYDETYVADMLIEYLYKYKNSSYKTTLWECFGDIMLENLKKNLKNKYAGKHTLCETCGKRIEMKSNRTKYCEDCAEKNEQEQLRLRVKKHRTRKSVTI
ncbi:RNA dependent RNA polymerase [Paenibacillus sp. TH7-28]